MYLNAYLHWLSFFAKMSTISQRDYVTLPNLAPFGIATQTESLLSMLCCQMWPKLVWSCKHAVKLWTFLQIKTLPMQIKIKNKKNFYKNTLRMIV